jgi:hypothetical protein
MMNEKTNFFTNKTKNTYEKIDSACCRYGERILAVGSTQNQGLQGDIA